MTRSASKKGAVLIQRAGALPPDDGAQGPAALYAVVICVICMICVPSLQRDGWSIRQVGRLAPAADKFVARTRTDTATSPA